MEVNDELHSTAVIPKENSPPYRFNTSLSLSFLSSDTLLITSFSNTHTLSDLYLEGSVSRKERSNCFFLQYVSVIVKLFCSLPVADSSSLALNFDLIKLNSSELHQDGGIDSEQTTHTWRVAQLILWRGERPQLRAQVTSLHV
jgi:hypothetical protein